MPYSSKLLMREHKELIRAWRGLTAGTEAVLVTVVATQGSTYRRKGARMLLTRDGWAAGSISGGCIEGELYGTAFDRTEEGAVRVRFDTSKPGDEIFGYGTGCSGIADVIVERLAADGGVLRVLDEVHQSRSPMWIETEIQDLQRLGEFKVHAGRELPAGSESTMAEQLRPPIHLIIVGAGHDAIPVASLGTMLGWDVTVVDGRASYATPQRFPDAQKIIVKSPDQAFSELALDPETAVVLMSHSFTIDRAILDRLAGHPAFYVGLLGPRRRAEQIMGVAEIEVPNFYTPVGLDIGAEDPAEIALAIVSEIQAVHNHKTGASLSGKSHIH